MEGIDHVYIAQVGSGCLVGDVDHMIQGKIPDREGFELCISGILPLLEVVIEVAQGCGELAAARSGTGYHNDGACGLDILVGTVSLIAYNQVDVLGITARGIVQVTLIPSVQVYS